MAWNFKRFFSRKTTAIEPKGAKSWFHFRSGVKVTEDTAMKVSAFYRGLIYISTQIAKLPWEVKDAKLNIIDDDVAFLLNTAPNEEMNSFQFRLVLMQSAIIHGNGYAEIERDGRRKPIALWWIPSGQVEPVRSESGKLLYKVTDQAKGDIFLQSVDVFHLKNFHTKDGIVGQGLVAYASETLGIAIAADTMAGGIFQNGGIPAGILSHPGTLSDAAYNRLKENWEKQTGGRKTGGTAILEENMKYDSIKLDTEMLQFLESRKFGVLEMARFFGIPPTKFFDTEAATYSNVEQANLEVATDTLDSWAVNLEMEADIKILNKRFAGKYSEIDLYSIFRGDMKTRSDYNKTMMSIGAMTPNQVRAREGLAGYPEGDKYYIATNNFTPVDRMDEVIDAQIKSKTTPATPAKSEDDDTKELKQAAIRYLQK